MRADCWTDDELQKLRDVYTLAGDVGFVDLAALALELGRPKPNVCRKARQIGLVTNPNRAKVQSPKVRTRKYQSEAERNAAASDRVKLRLATEGHPRGMAGKRHTAETKDIIAATSALRWANMSDGERLAHTEKAAKASSVSRNGGPPKIARGTWKAGWRQIGAQNKYYRSRWEANYARYLQWLQDSGEIKSWAHEPETFWFDAIKRGVRSYKPDFRVVEKNGSTCLHEVKGWMDSRSKTTLSRMKKYFPAEKIILIDERQYKAIRKAVMGLIPEWEDSSRDDR